MNNSSTLPAMVATSELDEIRTLIEARSAIFLDSSRERFFFSRVNQYLRECGEPDGTALIQRIRKSNIEYDSFLAVLLSQETSFFRYPDVFRSLEQVVLPDIQGRKLWNNPRTLRIWNAGCATGEEAYSVGITALETLPFPDAWEIEILATDISREALLHAERGIYTGRGLTNVSSQQLQTHFTPNGNSYQVKPRLRRLISFVQMNLAQAPYIGRMVCIFCMNVLMYFSEERRNALLQRFYDTLNPGGFFFLGHSESIKGASVNFSSAVHGDCQYYFKPFAAGSQQKSTAPGCGS